MTYQKGNQVNKGRTPWNKNKSISEEHRRNISLAKKGQVPWNKGKNGMYSEEQLKAIRQRAKDHAGLTDEQRHKLSVSLTGRKLSEEHKRKIGLKSSGRYKGESPQQRLGLIGAMEWKAKLSTNSWTKRFKGNFPQLTLQKKSFNMLGEKNPLFGIDPEKHPSWLGGLSFQPYTKDFNKQFKLAIRIRDNWCCVKCGMWDVDHKKLFKGQSLQIHHLDYNKSLSIPQNTCALCCRCNNEVNFNRKHWTSFFQSILSERFGYKYSSEGIILGVSDESH